MFLRKGGVITCTVTGSRQYSADLAQGGMEIPCTYSFSGEDCDVQKLEKILALSNQNPVKESEPFTGSEKEPKNVMKHPELSTEKEPKRIKIDESMKSTEDDESRSAETIAWVVCRELSLSVGDRSILRSGDDLSDKHINFGQQLIKRQCPEICGLKSTLIISKRSYHYPDTDSQGRFLQVIHTANHWVLASNIGGAINEVTVYDSLNKAVDKSTHDLLKRLLKKVKIKVFLIQPQLQVGIHDCGVFALAFCTSLALGKDLSDIKFDQARMRNHLEHCFENKCLSSFPKLEK